MNFRDHEKKPTELLIMEIAKIILTGSWKPMIFIPFSGIICTESGFNGQWLTENLKYRSLDKRVSYIFPEETDISFPR